MYSNFRTEPILKIFEIFLLTKGKLIILSSLWFPELQKLKPLQLKRSFTSSHVCTQLSPLKQPWDLPVLTFWRNAFFSVINPKLTQLEIQLCDLRELQISLWRDKAICTRKKKRFEIARWWNGKMHCKNQVWDNCFSNEFVVMIIPVENFRSTYLLSSSTTAMITVGLTCL